MWWPPGRVAAGYARAGRAGAPEELTAHLRRYARMSVAHVQILIAPNSLASVEAFAPVLALLDRAGAGLGAGTELHYPDLGLLEQIYRVTAPISASPVRHVAVHCGCAWPSQTTSIRRTRG